MPRKAKPSEVLALAEGARKSLDVAELAHALLSEFGGIGEFAAAYVAEYKIAKGEGWFDKLSGGKCNWTEAGSGAEINAAMAGKSLDIGLAIGSSPTAAGISQKLPYELIGMVDNIGPAEDMVVRKAANIKTPADFKGKKVATPFGSTSHFRLLGFLKVNNLTEKDVTVLDLKPDAEVAAWTRGDIDAAYVWSPAKAKMLESVLRMVSWASSRDQGGDDAGSLTDDELDQEIAAAARAAGIVGDPDHDDTPAAPQAA